MSVPGADEPVWGVRYPNGVTTSYRSLRAAQEAASRFDGEVVRLTVEPYEPPVRWEVDPDHPEPVWGLEHAATGEISHVCSEKSEAWDLCDDHESVVPLGRLVRVSDPEPDPTDSEGA